MDGVLIDARDWHFNALNIALGEFGFNISREAHLTEFNGLPTKVKLNMLTEEQGLPLRLHPLISAIKQRETIKIAMNNCLPVFQHEYLFQQLKLEKYQIGVVTNSIRKTTTFMLDLACLINYFDVIITNEDVSLPKPAPEPYLQACKKLNLEPKHALVIEDNSNGVLSAQSAGCRILKVENPSEVNWENISKVLEI
jgi:beta-phosphoglucomutase-like phosphatase (HAD superfamily)